MKCMIYLAASVLIFISKLSAQVGPGFFLGGSSGFSISSSESKDGSTAVKGPVTTTYNIIPRAGYYFTDELAAGVMVGYAGSTVRNTTGVETTTSTNTIQAALFGRYAIGVGESTNFAFFGDLSVGIASTTGKTEVGTVSAKADPRLDFYLGLSPGIIFFPVPKFGLEASIGNIFYLGISTVTNSDNEEETDMNTNISFLNFNTMSFNLGLNYYFNRE